MKDSAATPGRRAGSADEPSPVATGLEALSWAVSSGAAGEVVRHVEARRRAGLLRGGGAEADASDVAREFADEGAAGEGEAALAFE